MAHCSDTSRTLDEPIAGTALDQTTHWILLEHRGPWAPKAIDAPGLTGAVRAHLQHVLDTVENSRLQLMRRPASQSGPLRVFLVISTRTQQRVHSVLLPDLAALCRVDLVSILNGRTKSPLWTAPLYLVCCHGVRDRCCARQGMPVFSGLEAIEGDAVWQTTHLGGHRFAATVLVLPHGQHYGRVEAEEVEQLRQGVHAGRIYDPERFRGWTAQPRAAQAADAWLRQTHPDAVVRWAGSAEGQHRFSVDGRSVCVDVQSEPALEGRPFSCGDSTPRHPLVHHCTETSG
jgi:hypothetical protein